MQNATVTDTSVNGWASAERPMARVLLVLSQAFAQPSGKE